MIAKCTLHSFLTNVAFLRSSQFYTLDRYFVRQQEESIAERNAVPQWMRFHRRMFILPSFTDTRGSIHTATFGDRGKISFVFKCQSKLEAPVNRGSWYCLISFDAVWRMEEFSPGVDLGPRQIQQETLRFSTFFVVDIFFCFLNEECFDQCVVHIRAKRFNWQRTITNLINRSVYVGISIWNL